MAAEERSRAGGVAAAEGALAFGAVLGSDEVVAAGLAAGLDAVGVAPAEPFEPTRATLVERRRLGLHGGMAFTYRNPDRSTDPAHTVPGARSLVVGALGYRPPEQPLSNSAAPKLPPPDSTAPSRLAGQPAGQPVGQPVGQPAGRVAAYACADHYGRLRNALGEVAELLRGAGHTAVVVADDNALVDREAAYRAGLGWYGKNSNILLPGQGSWFVLGSVITTAPLAASEPVADQCGPCRRCLDGCPTGAIVAPGVVDARRCLAWLVQADGDFPVEFREALGDRIYGCDDCQEVCPPNRTAKLDPQDAASDGEGPAFGESAASDGDGPATAGDTATDENTGWVDLVELLAMDDEELMARYGRWYIPRRDPRYVRRNALVALGNSGRCADPGAITPGAITPGAIVPEAITPEVRATVERYRSGPDPMLARHADWAAHRLGVSGVPERPVANASEQV